MLKGRQRLAAPRAEVADGRQGGAQRGALRGKVWRVLSMTDKYDCRGATIAD